MEAHVEHTSMNARFKHRIRVKKIGIERSEDKVCQIK